MIQTTEHYLELLEFISNNDFYQCVRTFNETKTVNKYLKEEVEEKEYQIVITLGNVEGNMITLHTRELYDRDTENFEIIWDDILSLAGVSKIVRNLRFSLDDEVFSDVTKEVKSGKIFEKDSKYQGDFV